jgi:hypothetical protein
MHTLVRVTQQADGFLLKGQKEVTRITYAANVPGRHALAATAPVFMGQPSARVLRYGSAAQHQDLYLATVISAGTKPVKLSLEKTAGRLRIQIGNQGFVLPL